MTHLRLFRRRATRAPLSHGMPQQRGCCPRQRRSLGMECGAKTYKRAPLRRTSAQQVPSTCSQSSRLYWSIHAGSGADANTMAAGPSQSPPPMRNPSTDTTFSSFPEDFPPTRRPCPVTMRRLSTLSDKIFDESNMERRTRRALASTRARCTKNRVRNTPTLKQLHAVNLSR